MVSDETSSPWEVGGKRRIEVRKAQELGSSTAGIRNAGYVTSTPTVQRSVSGMQGARDVDPNTLWYLIWDR